MQVAEGLTATLHSGGGGSWAAPSLRLPHGPQRILATAETTLGPRFPL